MDKTLSLQQASEALNDLLTQAVDLESVCRSVLQFVLEAIERTSGALLVISPFEGEHPHFASDLTLQQELSKAWRQQLDDPNSPLLQLCERVYESGMTITEQSPSKGSKELSDLALAMLIAIESEPEAILIIQGEACSQEEVEQLTELIPLIGQAVRDNRVPGTMQARIRELAVLQTDLTRMGFKADFDLMQAQVIQGANRILGCEASALILLDETQDDWMVRKSLRDNSEWIYQVSPKSGKGLVKECLHSGTIFVSNNVSTDPRFDPSSDGLSDIQTHSVLCAPLLVNGQIIGAIEVINKRNGDFEHSDQDLMSMIAGLAANAMHGTRIIQQLKIANADLEANRWELLGSRNTLRALFDNLPMSLYIIDQDFKLIAVNKFRAERSKQAPQSLFGKSCFQALFNRDQPCPDCRVAETLEDGRNTERSERRWNSGEDSTEWEISTYPILDENDRVWHAILAEQDETERHHLEAILAQSEKLAAVGQLAAGVAHEINNPLTAIIANAQIIHRELPPDHDLQESVDLIARAGARAAQVVRNLLDFARKEEYHLGLTDLNDTLEKSIELVQHELIARGVRLKLELDQNLPAILSSQDHMQSVWLNLLLNAIDSLDKSPGKVKITTRRLGDEIHVSVSDNGKGIPPERLTRIFEPFYTTKKAGRGTGLGLSVSHRIVKQHAGHIRVESQVGIGSTFTVVLPLS